mmetsp:Transcript_57086/g.158960  ORF Transcript_57086/g.158960 Transcript_57086/m.158960 type:complete len:257 (-) Transcript_57086:547-1317(-)
MRVEKRAHWAMVGMPQGPEGTIPPPHRAHLCVEDAVGPSGHALRVVRRGALAKTVRRREKDRPFHEPGPLQRLAASPMAVRPLELVVLGEDLARLWWGSARQRATFADAAEPSVRAWVRPLAHECVGACQTRALWERQPEVEVATKQHEVMLVQRRHALAPCEAPRDDLLQLRNALRGLPAPALEVQRQSANRCCGHLEPHSDSALVASVAEEARLHAVHHHAADAALQALGHENAGVHANHANTLHPNEGLAQRP